MELRMFTEPQQGATYDDLLRWPWNRSGWASAPSFAPITTCTWERSPDYRSDRRVDHARRTGPRDHDASVSARLMSAATFRLPGPLAISVAQVDEMSGGRVELGIGTGWFADEHAAYGIAFPHWESVSNGSASSWRSSPASGRRRLAIRTHSPASTITSPTVPARPKPVQRPRPPI